VSETQNVPGTDQRTPIHILGIRLRRQRDGRYYSARTPLGQVAISSFGDHQALPWIALWWPPGHNGRAIIVTDLCRLPGLAAAEMRERLVHMVRAVRAPGLTERDVEALVENVGSSFLQSVMASKRKRRRAR
jgi:hypothetical protein